MRWKSTWELNKSSEINMQTSDKMNLCCWFFFFGGGNQKWRNDSQVQLYACNYHTWMRSKKKTQLLVLDAGIPSMYGIFTCIYHEHQLNEGKYTIHRWYGWWWVEVFSPCSWVTQSNLRFFISLPSKSHDCGQTQGLQTDSRINLQEWKELYKIHGRTKLFNLIIKSHLKPCIWDDPKLKSTVIDPFWQWNFLIDIRPRNKCSSRVQLAVPASVACVMLKGRLRST